MKLFNKYTFLAIGLCLLFNTDAFAQCKNFTKKEGFPAVSPYKHNGQITSTKFMPGDEAEIEMTFNGGNEYRVLVVNQKVIGNVELKIMDKSKKVLFSSKDGDEMPKWDFRVKNTQNLIVAIKVPEMDEHSNKITPEGCVSILVGFKTAVNPEKMLKLDR